jgi:hypothetical protein
MEKPNFNSVTNMAADHVRNDKTKLELTRLKEAIFNESNMAEKSFEKLMDKMSVEETNKCALELENLLYAIGRTKAYSMN